MRPALLVSLFVLACASLQRVPEPAEHHVWFKGAVDEAFAAAKQQNKPIFLYWGAVWCPPCNQLKNEVFSTPEFAELMKTVIPVYLDGDSERAQLWGEKLHASGYPTLLMLRPDGTELMRMGEFVELPEFTAAFKSALAADRPLKEIIAHALEGKATEDEWNILAYAGWDDVVGIDLATRLKVVLSAPESLIVQRAVLSAKLLESASQMPPDAPQAHEIRARRKELLDAMLPPFDAGIFAARSTIVTMSQEIVTWLYPHPQDPERNKLIERWVKAADWIGSNPDVSLGTRMLSIVPAYQLWQLQHPKEALPKDLVQEIHTTVAQADEAAKTSYARHAVISDGAQILADAGDIAGARVLLLKELKTTDTPWYYQATLAHIEMKAGNEEAALEWSAKARESAKGNATRLQWTASDIQLNATSSRPDRGVRVANLLREFYEIAFSLNDGFVGRNASRTRGVTKALQELRSQSPVQEVIQEYGQRCINASTHGPEANCAWKEVDTICTKTLVCERPAPCVAHFQEMGFSMTRHGCGR